MLTATQGGKRQMEVGGKEVKLLLAFFLYNFAVEKERQYNILP